MCPVEPLPDEPEPVEADDPASSRHHALRAYAPKSGRLTVTVDVTWLGPHETGAQVLTTAAIHALAQVPGIEEIRLVNRTLDKARALAAEFGGGIVAHPWERRADTLDGAATLVNCTNQGMVGKPALEITLDALPRTAIVGDLIYTPPMTPLLAAAKARGHVVVNGLGLLLNQARPAFQAWFGVLPSITPGLRRAIEATF